MSVAEHKQLVARVFTEAFNAGRLEVIDEVVGAAAVDHQHPDEPDFGVHLKQVITAMRTAFPDLHVEITQMIGEGEWVALHSVMTGTHTGVLGRPLTPPNAPPQVPPTGRSVRVPHMHMIRFREGRNTELLHVWDTMTLVGQLGLLPGPTPALAPAHATR